MPHRPQVRIRKTVLILGAVLLLLSSLFGRAHAETRTPRAYILSTASTGGVYYPVGVAIATLVKLKLEPDHGITMAAINSAGSGENVKLLRERQAQFAILQGIYGDWAWKGEGPVRPDGPQPHLRAVTALWQNVEHFVVRKDHVRTGTLEDLSHFGSAKLSAGIRNSGSEGSTRAILDALGIVAGRDLTLAFLGYGPSADALQNGTIAGFSMPAGVPVSSVAQVFASAGDEVQFLEISDEEMARINPGYELWTRYVIAPRTYPGQTEAVRTLAMPNFLAVHAEIGEEAVYLITKAIYANLGFLRNIHKATRDMSLETALEGLPVPLHPGAARFYREAGLEIPAHLISN